MAMEVSPTSISICPKQCRVDQSRQPQQVATNGNQINSLTARSAQHRITKQSDHSQAKNNLQ
eukprot:6480306-Amphidinium_carterae.1